MLVLVYMLVYICKWFRFGGFVNLFVDVKNLMCFIYINLVFVNVFCGEFFVRYLMSSDFYFFKYWILVNVRENMFWVKKMYKFFKVVFMLFKILLFYCCNMLVDVFIFFFWEIWIDRYKYYDIIDKVLRCWCELRRFIYYLNVGYCIVIIFFYLLICCIGKVMNDNIWSLFLVDCYWI